MLNLLSLFSPFSSTSHTYTHNQKPERPQGSAFASCVCWQTSILSVSPSLSLSLPVCSIEIHSQKLSHWLVTAARSQSGFSAELSIMIWVWWPLQDGWWGMRVPGERGEGGGGSATLTSLLWVGGYGRGTLCIVEDDKGSPRWPHFAVREVFAPWETVLHMRQGILSNELKIFWKQIHSNPIRPFTVQKNKKKNTSAEDWRIHLQGHQIALWLIFVSGIDELKQIGLKQIRTWAFAITIHKSSACWPSNIKNLLRNWLAYNMEHTLSC